MKRRQALQAAGLAAVSAAAACAAPQSRTKGDAVDRRRVLRIAHLTDVHIQPELEAERWFGRCLRHVQSMDDPPDILFNGGDALMDCLAQGRDRARIQADAWNGVLRDECSLPIVHCIGNHDVWGWDREKSGAAESDPLFGKRWALDAFGMEERHYSFDRAGWRFIVLDSTHRNPGGVYYAELDGDQFDWLAETLARTPARMPVLVLSHIPILAACAYFDGENEKSGNWVVPGAWMHRDARRIKDLFHGFPNVKACLSGHIHLVDRVDYLGVSYYCNGAVSGAWWKGDFQETPPGFGLVDLYDDGTCVNRYMTYGWAGQV